MTGKISVTNDQGQVAALATNVELDNPTYPSAELIEDTVHDGQKAWQRLQNHQTWPDWCALGRAHVIGRAGAMREACRNTPRGRRYNGAFTAWQDKHGFENLDKGDRCRLFEVMDHFVEIDAWRNSLTPHEQAGLNHPATVLRRWKAAMAKQNDGHPQGRDHNKPPETGSLNPLAWANASPTERAHFISSVGWQAISAVIPSDWRPIIEDWLRPKPTPVVIDQDGNSISDDLSILS